MNYLVRMRYGRSGSMMNRVLVSAPCQQIAPNPRWLKVVEVLFWILIPALVIRFAVPPTPRQLTVIDTSRLMEKPPLEMEKPVIPEPKQIPKIKPPVVPPAKLERPKVETVRKPQEIPSAPPQDVVRPSIVRPSGPRSVDAGHYQPRIARERIRLETDTGTPAATRIRRETAVGDAPSGGVTIARTRGVAVTDAPVSAGYRVAALRRTPVAGDATSGGGAGGGGAPRQITRNGRPSGYAGLAEGTGPMVTATRGRATATGTGGGEGSSSVGLVRGVSLMSLEICSSPQEEEDHIRAVLGVIGSRQSCADAKGEFQFKGTKRISSFNLMIYPAKGRRPTNRCEELEYAYRCLTTH